MSAQALQSMHHTPPPPVVQPRSNLIRLRAADPFRAATERQQNVAVARLDIASYLLGLEAQGHSTRSAIALFVAQAAVGELRPLLQAALATVGKAGRACPGKTVLREWRDIVARGGGRVDLLERHKGRVLAERPSWWGPAIEYFNQPSKPDIAAVHRRLVEVDKLACTYDQVRSYLNGVPAMAGRNSPARIGKKLYRLTQKAFVRRYTLNALPGDVYVADGYRADVYLAHPVTGGLWRPELTIAIDLRSRYPVGWRADEHEGTVAVQGMWAQTFARWQHVPPILYIDNGSGYKNKLMDGTVTGFYDRAGVQEIIHALPGNPHGKGWVERFFRTIKDDFLKNWQPQFYCGTDAAPELANTVREVKAGRLRPPSLAQFGQAFDEWIGRYVQRPHPEDKSQSIASVWAGLVPLRPEVDALALRHEATVLTVRRGMLKHGQRHYQHPDLLAFNGQKVLLEYDLTNDAVAVVRDLQGRLICDAHLARAMDAVSTTRLEQKRRQRAKDAAKRLEIKLKEAQARAGLVVDAEAIADAVLPARPAEPLTLDLADVRQSDNLDLEIL